MENKKIAILDKKIHFNDLKNIIEKSKHQKIYVIFQITSSFNNGIKL